jgi:hypothetical protein
MWLLWSNGCSPHQGRCDGCSLAPERSTVMDIGVEQRPYILEPVEDPVPSRIPAADDEPEQVEVPTAVPEEVAS